MSKDEAVQFIKERIKVDMRGTNVNPEIHVTIDDEALDTNEVYNKHENKTFNSDMYMGSIILETVYDLDTNLCYYYHRGNWHASVVDSYFGKRLEDTMLASRLDISYQRLIGGDGQS